MSVIYQSQFTRAGSLARDGFADGMFITFAENEATDDMTDYCFLHTHGRRPLTGPRSAVQATAVDHWSASLLPWMAQLPSPSKKTAIPENPHQQWACAGCEWRSHRVIHCFCAQLRAFLTLFS